MAAFIPEAESLTVEFKSDRRRLSDRDLVEAVVCLANTEGGTVFLGVENDGTPTGLHPAHRHLAGLTAMIANRTIPPITVRVESIDVEQQSIAKITVPKMRRVVATSDGVLQRRRLLADGSPQCVPFYPHELTQRESSLGLLDHSALPVPDATPKDTDPLERERLRQMIERYGGDSTLIGLGDEELDGALGLARSEAGRRVLTVAGLLILGRASVIRDKIPTHEVAFQVLNGTQVRVNDFYRTPLLKTFERVMEQFTVRVSEDEVQEGLFRVPVPDYDVRAFREAFVNALIHRDYSRLGATHVRMETDGVTISNPGGFVEGVTLNNLLVVEPKPRNPLLADVVKRIGLAERTGRGVDLIYRGMLRYGRPEPDYSYSDATTVVVRLSSAAPDTDFLKMIIAEEERCGAPLPLDSLIILSRLRKERRLTAGSLAAAIQKRESDSRAVLERLMEAGLVTAHGTTKGRTYTLSSKVYQKLGKPDSYIRQAGFSAIQQEQMVTQFVSENGAITRSETASLCRITDSQASYLLRKLRDAGKLKMVGRKGGAHYTLP
jgi:ATP-dependent DNA helicase RecG